MECDSSYVELDQTNDENGQFVEYQGPSNEVIYEKLKSIEEKVDKLLQLYSGNHSTPCNSSDEVDQVMKKPLEFKRIRSVNDLYVFEKKLENESFRSELLSSISYTFRNMKKYDKSERRFAYKIIDTFTKRRLFSFFSWSGKKSRNGKKNHCLEKHSVFIGFILSAIRIKISKFELCNLEDIFQILCRNKNSTTECSSSEANKFDEC